MSNVPDLWIRKLSYLSNGKVEEGVQLDDGCEGVLNVTSKSPQDTDAFVKEFIALVRKHTTAVVVEGS